MSTPAVNLLDDFKWRGLFHQCTDETGLAEHLRAGVRRVYAGFDPTADSLTIGNLVPITMLARFQRAGHTPVVVMGGGTGLIGDPSGKEAERNLRTKEEIAHNVASQRKIFEHVIDFSGRGARVASRGMLVDNLDWLGELRFVDALRDIGKHFSVNMMIQKESVKERLHNREQGISYTEFSYMILQAYDFAHLFRAQGVTVQVGGSDQWGNIVAGCDLIRRLGATDALPSGPKRPEGSGTAFGLTLPLITKSDGGKFGKTESGAVWLTADRTSPYAFYQFWLNTADADAGRFLRIFTFLPRAEIEAIESAHAADPGKREAQRALARTVTEMMHGKDAMEQAEAAAKALFTGEVAGLSAEMLDEALAGAPKSDHDKSLLEGAGMPLLDLIAQTSLADSKGKARQLLAEGSISVNGHKAAADARVSLATLLHGRVITLRRGKKSWHITRWK